MSVKPLCADRRAVVVEIPLQLLTPPDKPINYATYVDPTEALANALARQFGHDKLFRLAGVPAGEKSAAIRLAVVDQDRHLLTVSVQAACLPLVPLSEMLPRVRVQDRRRAGVAAAAAARPSKFVVVEYAGGAAAGAGL